MNESKSNSPLVSVVIPVFNEEDNLAELYKRLLGLISLMPEHLFEILFVSDGSTDETNGLISKFHQQDSRFRGILLSRNFGHQAALSAGLANASGHIVAVIDGDLQDPPEFLAEMVSKLESGYDVVYGLRRKRKETWFKRLCYWSYYRILGKVSNIQIPQDAGDFCCMRRNVVDAINQQPENGRFIRGLRSWVGFCQTGIEYERNGRFSGSSKYSIRALIRLAYSGLFGFSSLPIKMMQFLGLAFSTVAIVIGLLYFVLAFTAKSPPGFPSLMISIWFLSGVQLFFMGLMGEYVYRTYQQSLRRSDYLVKEFIGIERDAS